MRKRRDFPSSGSCSTDSGANNNKKKFECYSRVYKRRKTKENVDIISNLPQDILHHIFSFLDTKQAIQTTCLLSKRWKHFWVSLPTLKFTYNEVRRKTITKSEILQIKKKKKTITRNEVMDFVDRVLMFRGNSNNLHEFTLVNNLNVIEVIDRLNTWILVCIIHNVQQLTLEAPFPEKFQLHHCLFTCKTLTKLEVAARSSSNRVSLSLPYLVTLPSLKTLSLSSFKFEDENSTNHLFSGCPILESLTLIFCEFPHNINVNISSPLLQHLVLESCETTSSNAFDLGPVLEETNFQWCAPNLISFFWSNHISKHFASKNLSSLVSASIHVDGDFMLSKEIFAPFMVNTLRGLHNVEDLTLSTSFLEVITGAPDLLDSQPTKFGNLRCLKLTGQWSSVDCIHAISYLLKISPNIETLSVGVHYGAPDLLEVQPTQCCNLRCLKLNAWLSRDCIYAIAYFLKMSPKIENISFMLHVSACNDKMHPYWNPDEVTSNSAKRGDCWKAGLSLEGLLNHVKCFELRYVTGLINELEFIEILLKNAMLLKELLISFFISCPHAKEKELEKRRLAKFSKKVLTFPKASSNVVIIFRYVK